MIPQDSELLRRYCSERSEEAFARLVERHLALVYAVALRRAGPNIPLAETITEDVFTGLAAQAQALQEHASLPGWLYSRAQSAELGRDSAPQQSDQLEPVIAEAINKMAELDRRALLLHYRDGLDFRTAGAVLEISDEEARQRITQALEKLRGILREGGKASPATIKSLATVLLASGLVKPPVGLARNVTKRALINTSEQSGSSSFLRTNGLKVAVAALVLVATVLALVVERSSRERRAARSREQAEMNRAARVRVRPNAEISPTGTEARQRRAEKLELSRPRVEVAESPKPPVAPPADPPQPVAEPSAQQEQDSPVITYFANVTAKLTRGQTMLTGGWRTASGGRTLLLVTPEISDGETGAKQIDFQTIWVAGPDDVLTELGLDNLFIDSRTNSVAHLLSEPETSILLAGLVGGTGVNVLTAPRLTTKEGMQARIDVTQSRIEGDLTIQVGPAVEILPTLGADGTLDLTVNAKFSELKAAQAEPVQAEPVVENPPVLDAVQEELDEP
jgi:DNA-directed RNA polymerase specialized sigma24 family protein